MEMELIDDLEAIWPQQNENSQEETWDFPVTQSTPSTIARCQPCHLGRPLDFPSIRKHYGLLTFVDTQYPIIYRLIQDRWYIPYIRFTYVLQVFHHPLYKTAFSHLGNVPLLEMTKIEREYYRDLSSSSLNTDWTEERLLSVSILDGILAILRFTRDFDEQNAPASEERCKEWRENLNRIRQEARDRWILDENRVLQRIHEEQSSSIITNTLAQRRSYFEERLNLSIVDESGGFLQIDSFIYPFVKDAFNHQIYLHIDDLRQHLQLISLYDRTIPITDHNASIIHAYNVVVEQAQNNFLRHGRQNNLSKYLPTPRFISEDECRSSSPFITLETLRSAYEQRSQQHLFIQLFETGSIEEIQTEYKNNLARQFILASKRTGGFVQHTIPFLINAHGNHLLIPSHLSTSRRMNHDERLFLNLMLLYRGWWKDCLSKKKCWFLKEMTDEQENLHIQILFHHQRTRS